MIESELKYEFPDLGAYERVRAYLASIAAAPATRALQKNTYFDTADRRLSRELALLRLRATEQRAVLTLKYGARLSEGFYRAEEIEAELTAEQVERALADPGSIHALEVEPAAAFRGRFGTPTLEIAGTLENERLVFAFDLFAVELDRMTFDGGGEEYEVEIETTRVEEARAWCQATFRAAGVEAVPSRETKVERMLRHQAGHGREP